MNKSLLLAVTFALLTVSCASTGSSSADARKNKSTAKCVGSAVLGAGGGALVGREFGGGKGKKVLTAAGALAGAALGSSVGCE